MSERYTKLFSLPENLYNEDCPVMICAGALSKDNQTNKVFVQLRLQNVDAKCRTIAAIKVSVTSCDPAGNVLGAATEYQYLDLETNRGEEFGSKTPIALVHNASRSFSVSIPEVVFTDGQIWTGEKGNWISLKQKTLEESLGTILAEQYRRDTFGRAKYEVLAQNGVWMCACGTLNTIEERNCCQCHNSEVELFKALDHNTLAENLNAYTEKTKAENNAKEIKDKRIKLTAIIVAVVILFVGLITIPKAVKANKQEAVVKALIGTSWDGGWGYYVFEDEDSMVGMHPSFYGNDYNSSPGIWRVVNLEGNVMRIRQNGQYYYNVVFSEKNGRIEIDSIYETDENGTYRGKYLTRRY